MKIVVRVELVTDWGEKRSVEVGRVDRPSQTLGPDDVGLTLDDGKRLLHSLQQSVVHAAGPPGAPGGTDVVSAGGRNDAGVSPDRRQSESRDDPQSDAARWRENRQGRCPADRGSVEQRDLVGFAASLARDVRRKGASRFGIPEVGFRDEKGEFMERALIEPDYSVANDADKVAAGRDRQIEEAVKVLLTP
jgi:hypothetical protein